MPAAAATTDTSTLRGSCLCGAVTYEIHGELGTAYYCHCSRCRKGSGSAFSANAVVSPRQLLVTSGQALLKSHVTAEGIHRSFCSDCGSQLFVSQGEQMRLRLGSLDTPLPTPPTQHIHTASRADWFEIHDELPQYSGRPPG